MASRAIRIPGPDHPITIAPNPARVRVMLGDVVLADTRRALTLREAQYPAVHYIPREDADMALLKPSAHMTYCPFKGDCSYLDLPGGGEGAANAVWSYERPFPAVAEIAGHLAFYADRVTIDFPADA
ncbi:MAG: hypothetical protein JWL96_1009 [Sphingomonas bacterium]|uniref:DUF427 domain-containing protein n=1 Tax=Sphingomonas bacterium TaxID=1895847 RepID=UPI002634E2A8|nr:DUF427 domain-containing protein [Sphingomonas bacterium]MDB5708939.1 hypothetical protein [Sphingomonas bacterium]